MGTNQEGDAGRVLLNVHVLEYSHRHGTDIGVYITKEQAENGILCLIEQWMYDDYPEELIPELQQAVVSRDVARAQCLWTQNTTEWFNLSEQKIDITTVDVKTIKSAHRGALCVALHALAERLAGTEDEVTAVHVSWQAGTEEVVVETTVVARHPVQQISLQFKV